MPKYKNILNLSKRALHNRIRRSTPFHRMPNSPGELRSNENINENATNQMDLHQINTTNVIEESFGDNYSEDEMNSFDQDNTSVEIQKFLRSWATEFGIPCTALNKLLEYLKLNGFPCLPKDARTLLETPTSRDIIAVEPGKYAYFGITESLNRILQKVNVCPQEILLDFNIDGVPLSKSTQNSFWVILSRIYNIPESKIFVIAIYHGYQKPKHFNEILRPFVNELKILTTSFMFENQPVRVKIRAFILDAPARSSCLGTKSHNAYFGCTRCV